MEQTDKPLRILLVFDLPLDPRLGASRIWVELAEQWRAAGHAVEIHCLIDAFPNPVASPQWSVVRRILFAYKAARFVRKNAGRFDIITALLGSLPFSKAQLHFKGLLVAQSVGLPLLYERFHQFARKRWPRQSKGKFSGRIFYSLARKRLLRAAEKSLRRCDLINLLNHDELDCIRAEISPSKPAIVEPNGLTPERHRALSVIASAVEDRWRARKISFIGMWSERKGSNDWGEILRRVRQQEPEARFVFLGTMTAEHAVLDDLNLVSCPWVQIIPEYDPDQLPQLLADCTVGAFPSYIEGFGLAVLEQLAAGIPTVAYDAPGPREMLRSTLSELLVPPSDVEAFAQAVSKILRSDLDEYCALSRRSAEVTRRFLWPAIAQDTLLHYRRFLGR
jgi:glycosyltransferase involved in cell wall biosynthesis